MTTDMDNMSAELAMDPATWADPAYCEACNSTFFLILDRKPAPLVTECPHCGAALILTEEEADEFVEHYYASA